MNDQDNAYGNSVSLALSATDYVNTPTFSATGLPSGLSINSSTGLISGTLSSGDASSSPYAVTVTAADATYSSSQPFPWTVSTIYLPPPGDQTNLDDDTVSLSVAALYHGSGSVSYHFSGLPTGLTGNATTGLISGTITNTADVAGPYDVTVTAAHSSDSATLTINWEVDPRVTVDSIDDQTNVKGDSVSVTVTAEEGSSDSVTWSYSASGLPTGLSINSATGVISGTITAAVGTSDTVTVGASDGAGSASQTFDWNVLTVSLSNPGDQGSVGSSSINLALSATVASGYTASYSASGLPSGLSLNSSTGVISGTLSSGATGHGYAVSVSATAGGVTSSQAFTWLVGTVIVAPVADQTNTEGGTVSLAISAHAASGTLSYSAFDLPPSLSISSSTGVISGTVGAGDAANGPYTVTVVATNGTVANSQTFDWTLNPKVVVTAVDDQTNTEGGSVSIGVTASEAGATLSYSATGLPAGLSINSSTGVISGTVSTGDSAASPYTVAVTVSDGTYSSDVTFNWITMHGSDHAPVLTTPGTQVNVVGDSVNVALTATDADGSDTLTFSADGLPDGLDIDPATGIISGTVAEDALQTTPYVVTLTVDDGNGGSDSTTFSWLVNDSAFTVSAATITPTEGVDAGDVTVGTFTDTDPNWDPSMFMATINWGDGTTDEGTVDGSNGSYTVAGDHVYAHPGSYNPQITVTDGVLTESATGAATVGAASITLNGSVVEGALAGTSVTGTWASFTDQNPNDAAGSYTATINWGDGSSSDGTVTGEDGKFVVTGSHTFANAGTDSVTVTVYDEDATSATTTSTAQVGDLFAGESATLDVASFTVADTSAVASAYTATVDWGDGSSSSATVSGAAGVFTVEGTHAYSVDSGDGGAKYTVTVSITGPNAATLDSSSDETLNATTTVSVVRPPMLGYADEVLAQPNVALTNVEVATFAEPDVSDTTSEFTATIYWGDGSSSRGTVTGSNGLFHVLGSHTYTIEGAFSIQVDVSQNWNVSLAALLVNSIVSMQPSKQKSNATGPWIISRDPKGAKAFVTSRAGNTIKELAATIGLDDTEWKKWLKGMTGAGKALAPEDPRARVVFQEDKKPHPLADLTPDTKLEAGQQFYVPNTVEMIWVGDLGGIGQADVGWQKDFDQLTKLGFNVETLEYPSKWATTEEIYRTLHNFSSSAILQGIHVVGHGERTSFDTKNREVEIKYETLESKLSYHLGIVNLNVCNGGWSSKDPEMNGSKGGKDLLSNSKGAKFYGIKRTHVPDLGPIPVDTNNIKNLIKPGDQGTNKD